MVTTNDMTAIRARELLRKKLVELGVLNVTVKGKAVSFTDLARGAAIFVEVRGFTSPADAAVTLKAFGKANGFIVMFV